ncbi:Txe/YoeB family addiction module toxin [Cryobacterium sp. TMT2-10]|uniref:Txe/YoeB family addiction module toxin n=1 Tax=unclassified Cryobacterium TaxID=2649013 RepID=UPI00106B8ED6|nr:MULTISPECIES: Txe/YoeB family addiction module toxin [unclassified Cryobacterium]TFC85346.1 Txe/YoeB family addiction module toxin [Cryobacterium sp. TmT2-59]TFD35018.1 Txe/YoeB family addiction module toxin [Cryobacterium sp. TMT2-10]
MNIVFTDVGWNDYQHWVATDKAMVKRINKLIAEVQRTPFSGMGKPEALKHQLSGYWSRRITEEHRQVYAVEENQIVVIAARYHYSYYSRVYGACPRVR